MDCLPKLTIMVIYDELLEGREVTQHTHFSKHQLPISRHVHLTFNSIFQHIAPYPKDTPRESRQDSHYSHRKLLNSHSRLALYPNFWEEWEHGWEISPCTSC